MPRLLVLVASVPAVRSGQRDLFTEDGAMNDAEAYASYCGEGQYDDPPEPEVEDEDEPETEKGEAA